MVTEQIRQDNHAAYREMKPRIDRDYAAGRFLATHLGEVIGDADTINEPSFWVRKNV